MVSILVSNFHNAPVNTLSWKQNHCWDLSCAILAYLCYSDKTNKWAMKQQHCNNSKNAPYCNTKLLTVLLSLLQNFISASINSWEQVIIVWHTDTVARHIRVNCTEYSKDLFLKLVNEQCLFWIMTSQQNHANMWIIVPNTSGNIVRKTPVKVNSFYWFIISGQKSFVADVVY